MVGLFKMVLSPFVRCWHLKRGPLITLRPDQERIGIAGLTGTYCVCLRCGQQFAYDWEQMKFIDAAVSAPMLATGTNQMSAGKTS